MPFSCSCRRLITLLTEVQLLLLHQCLNPYSLDTGGILREDWYTPRYRRLELLRRIQPSPSRLTWDSKAGVYQFRPGASANPACMGNVAEMTVLPDT